MKENAFECRLAAAERRSLDLKMDFNAATPHFPFKSHHDEEFTILLILQLVLFLLLLVTHPNAQSFVAVAAINHCNQLQSRHLHLTRRKRKLLQSNSR